MIIRTLDFSQGDDAKLLDERCLPLIIPLVSYVNLGQVHRAKLMPLVGSDVLNNRYVNCNIFESAGFPSRASSRSSETWCHTSPWSLKARQRPAAQE